MMRLLRVLEVARYWLGRAGQAAVLLMLAIALFSLAMILPAQHDLHAQRDQLAWLQAQPKAAAKPAPVLPETQQLQEFYAQFPPQAALSELLRALHQLAQECGVELVLGEYKLSHERNALALQRYEIILPVKARYSELRRFLDQAALRFPTLGLSEISIKRDAVNEGEAEVRLMYVWLLKGEGA